MTRKTSRICAAAAVVGAAASAPAALLAQAPPAAESVELTEARRTPAEQQAAVYKDRRTGRRRGRLGATRACEGVWSVDDMRGIPRDRPEKLRLSRHAELRRSSSSARACSKGAARIALRRTENFPAQRMGHSHVRFCIAGRRSPNGGRVPGK